MILIALILWLLLGATLAWLSGRWQPSLPRWLSLATLSVEFVAVMGLWVKLLSRAEAASGGRWLEEINLRWIPQFGIQFHLGLDGLSLLLIVLVNFLGIMSVLASWQEIQSRVGFFHFNLLCTLAGLVGVFLALDLFLFYLFWEVMLVPLYFLIAIWGHERRIYAAMKFFLFTQASGLLMFLAIIGLYFSQGRSTGIYSFDYVVQLSLLKSSPLDPGLAFWLMLGFGAAFAVKLPMVPFHTWLPDAHTEAPTAGSVVLAGLLLKAGAYGFLRFLIPLFPGAAASIALLAMLLGIAGILYGALLAFGQTDLKRLVAYTSVSHMGFVLLGAFSMNQLALQGAVMIVLAHGVSTSALFILVGAIQHRLGTRQLDRMGGLWNTTPRLGGSAMVFALATLGLPTLGNFVGEFLVLLGVFQANPLLAILATLAFVVSTVYSLWMMQRVFFAPNHEKWSVPDSTLRESTMMAAMIAAIFWLGIFPQTVLNTYGREAGLISSAYSDTHSSSPSSGFAEQTPSPVSEGPGR